MRIRLRGAVTLLIAAGLSTVCRSTCWADAGGGTPLVPIIPGSPMVINALMGSINGTPVFVDDVLRPIDAELRRLAAAPNTTLNSFRNDAGELISRQVQSLVDDLVLGTAAEEGLDDSDKQRVEQIMNRAEKTLISKYGGVRALAEEKLRLQGTSLEKLLNDQRRGVVKQLFLQKVLYPKIQVTRDQLLADYNRNIKSYTVAAQIEMYTITLPISKWLPMEADPNDATKQRVKAHPTSAEVQQAINMALAKAHDLIKQLNEGADFAKLAQDNPGDSHWKDGGRWPKVKRGDLISQEWEDLAFSLKPNTIGEPIVINKDNPQLAGVIITKVGDVSPARVVPFSEAQGELDKASRDRQFAKLTSDYIQGIRAKSAIEGVDRMIDTATSAAVSRYISQ